MLLLYIPEIMLLGINPVKLKNYVHTKTCMGHFIAALFMIAKTLEADKIPFNGWIGFLF